MNEITLSSFNGPDNVHAAPPGSLAPAFLSLLWKEWREHEWKLAACCAVMGAYTACGIPMFDHDADFVVISAVMVAAALMPIFFAMNFGADRSRGVTEMMLTRPIPAWRLFAAKTVLGVACSWLSIALILFIGWVLMPSNAETAFDGMNEAYWYVIVGGQAAMLAVTVYLVTATLAARAPDEPRAGFIGLGVIAGLLLWFFILSVFPRWIVDQKWILALNPFVALTLSASRGHFYPTALWALLAAGVLWMWGARRYGRIEPAFYLRWRKSSQAGPERVGEQRSGSNVADSSSGPAYGFHTRPFANAWLALAWKEWREVRTVLPVALVVLVALPLALTMIAIWHADIDAVPEPEGAIIMLASFLTPMLAVLMGISAFGRDLKPKAHDFWASRPIDPGPWFTAKYLAGLAVVISALLIPYIIAFTLPLWPGPFHIAAYYSYRGTYWQPIPLYPLIQAGLACLWLVLMYSIAVMLACLLRYMVYAGILSTGVVMAIYLLPVSSDQTYWLNPFILAERFRAGSGPPPWLALAGFIAVGIAAIGLTVAIAYLSVRFGPVGVKRE